MAAAHFLAEIGAQAEPRATLRLVLRGADGASRRTFQKAPDRWRQMEHSLRPAKAGASE